MFEWLHNVEVGLDRKNNAVTISGARGDQVDEIAAAYSIIKAGGYVVLFLVGAWLGNLVADYCSKGNSEEKPAVENKAGAETEAGAKTGAVKPVRVPGEDGSQLQQGIDTVTR